MSKPHSVCSAIFVLLMMAAPPATAAEVKATSVLSAVTVFPRGAEVTRTALVRLAGGDHAVVLSDLPAEVVAGSIRVEGRSTGKLEIASIDTRLTDVPRSDPIAAQSERRRLEIAIEKLRDERALVEAEINAAKLQKSLVAGLAELPTRPQVPGQGSAGSGPDWPAIYALIGSRAAEAEKAALAAGTRAREIDRRIADVAKELAALAPAVDRRTEVRVHVVAAAPIEANLVIRYQVPSASWTALYDARLSTGSRATAPSLALVRRASVRQRTGEDWRDVAITLSTSRPAAGASAPELWSTAVDFEPERPPPRPVASAPSVERARREMSGGARDASAKLRAPASEPVAVEEKAAIVETAPFQALFQIQGKVTIPTSGDAKRLQLDTAQIEPALVVRAVPRLQQQAFLYARITTPRTTPYLPGVVSLFRDGTFVGNGRLPLLAPGQEHEIGFGADDAVQVRHAVVEEKRGETGLISSTVTDTRAYRITVRNMHERPISLSVLDQVPWSRQQDIKVELIGRTPPTKRDVNERRGVLAWEATMQPGEERVIEFGYRVSWPSGKRISYGR